jgi:hypothetical protein
MSFGSQVRLLDVAPSRVRATWQIPIDEHSSCSYASRPCGSHGFWLPPWRVSPVATPLIRRPRGVNP